MRAARESLHQPVTSTNTFLLLKHNSNIILTHMVPGEKGEEILLSFLLENYGPKKDNDYSFRKTTFPLDEICKDR